MGTVIVSNDNPWTLGPFEVTVHDESTGETGRYGTDAWVRLDEAEAYALDAIREGWPAAVIRSCDAVKRTYLSADHYLPGDGWSLQQM